MGSAWDLGVTSAGPALTRRVLLEWRRLAYPFGNTLANATLLHGLPASQGAASLLLIGCGDPRNLLASIGASSGRHALCQLRVALNDISSGVLARSALLLLMASELDPGSDADMDLLWDVWYNAQWLPDTCARTRPFLERLAQGR